MKSGKDIWGIVTEDPAEKEGKEIITIEMTETKTVRRTISVTKEELALIRTGELPVWVQECCLGESSGDEDYQVTFSTQEPEKPVMIKEHNQNQRILSVLTCLLDLCTRSENGIYPASAWGHSISAWNGRSCVYYDDRTVSEEALTGKAPHRKVYPVIYQYIKGTPPVTWNRYLEVRGLEQVEVVACEEGADRYLEIRFTDCDASILIQNGTWMFV